MLDRILDLLAHGITHASIGVMLLFLLVMTQVTVLTVTLYLHRSQTHRAVDFHPWLAHFFRFWTWLTTAMVTKEWVAVHRKHHACPEGIDDPHSPRIYGITKVLFRGTELYLSSRRDAAVLDHYGRGTPDDWLERNIYSVHCNWGPTLMAVVDLSLFGMGGMAIWAVQMMWIPFWAAGVVNGVGHWFGYRNFETPDKSTNFAPWGFWVGGEELHNNHHAFPSSATFAIRPFEFDIGWLVICGLVQLRLAKVLRSAPRDALHLLHPESDRDAMALVLKHRVQLMTAYFRDVIVPTFHDNTGASGEPCEGPSYRVRRGLANGGRWLSDRERDLLDAWVRTRPALLIVCQFRSRLDALTMRRQASALVDDIQEWVHDAQGSGVLALQAFATKLSGHHC